MIDEVLSAVRDLRLYLRWAAMHPENRDELMCDAVVILREALGK